MPEGRWLDSISFSFQQILFDSERYLFLSHLSGQQQQDNGPVQVYGPQQATTISMWSCFDARWNKSWISQYCIHLHLYPSISMYLVICFLLGYTWVILGWFWWFLCRWTYRSYGPRILGQGLCCTARCVGLVVHVLQPWVWRLVNMSQ